MISAERTLRASLAVKLWVIERKSHVMALVAEEGLAMFCVLNAMFSRITPQKVWQLLAHALGRRNDSHRQIDQP
jgi:hypothetical protein